MIKICYEKFLRCILPIFLIFSCTQFFNPELAHAHLENFKNNQGEQLQRSLENLKDLDSQTWQLIVYKDQKDKLILRIVGFNGSLRLDHPTNLDVQAGIKSLVFKDVTLSNLLLAKDNRDAAAEFDLESLFYDIKIDRPLRLHLQNGFSEIPIPPYLVSEWRSINSIETKWQNKN